MTFTTLEFRKAMGRYATGICIATAQTAPATRVGLTINSFTSVSLAPPLVLFCIENTAQALPLFAQAQGFAINILASDQEALSRAFAKRGQGAERWDGQDWHTGSTGAPELPAALAVLSCTRHSLSVAGDHHILIGEVTALQVREEGLPLLYWASGYQQIKTP